MLQYNSSNGVSSNNKKISWYKLTHISLKLSSEEVRYSEAKQANNMVGKRQKSNTAVKPSYNKDESPHCSMAIALTNAEGNHRRL